MKTILVTGAGGYIGAVLVPKLLERGYSVIAVDRYFFGKDKLPQHPNLRLVQEDVRRMDESCFTGVAAVIDLVAISNDPSGELFRESTDAINHIARVQIAKMAKKCGVKQYILPSSCSIYGFQNNGVIVDESSPINPLTAYARANAMAEQGVLPLADQHFCVTVLRQATVFGCSPRMRFDLAVNGMVLGAWSKGVIPLMRDGTQWRPFVHVQDTTDVMCLLLESNESLINGQIFNVGDNANNVMLRHLAEAVIQSLPRPVELEWYGDPDHRSYQVNFDKIAKTLQWRAKWSIQDGAREVYAALEKGTISATDQTNTLKWYQELTHWYKVIKELEMYGGMIELPDDRRGGTP